VDVFFETRCTLCLDFLQTIFISLVFLTFLNSSNVALLCYCYYLQRGLIARNTDAVIAKPILSVRLSVCPSVTFRCFVQTNEDTIVRFSAPSRTIILVSGEVTFIRIFAGDHH